MTIALSMLTGCGLFLAGFFMGKRHEKAIPVADLSHLKTPNGKFYTNRVVMEEKDE